MNWFRVASFGVPAGGNCCSPTATFQFAACAVPAAASAATAARATIVLRKCTPPVGDLTCLLGDLTCLRPGAYRERRTEPTAPSASSVQAVPAEYLPAILNAS